MNSLDSFMLLIAVGVIAYLLSCTFNYFSKKLTINNQKKDDIFKRKCDKLYDKAYSYYMTVCHIQPEVISNRLANEVVNDLIKTGKIDELYEVIRMESSNEKNNKIKQSKN